MADGAYHHFGQRYREILRADGIALGLRTSSGEIENIQRLDDGSVSVGLVQGGTGPLALDTGAAPESTALRSLATVAFQPVPISRTPDLSSGLQPLAGKKVAVGDSRQRQRTGGHHPAFQAYGVVADRPMVCTAPRRS